MNRDQIRQEAESFFEWPDHDKKDHVTTTSCLLFAEHVSKKAKLELQQLIDASVKTLNDNLHLCDGDVCTLRDLRDAVAKIVPDWIESSEFLRETPSFMAGR